MEKVPRAQVPTERKRVSEERLQPIIRGREQGDLRQRIESQHSGGFQPQTRRPEQWTVDPFWEKDRPTSVQHEDLPGPSTTTSGQELFAPMPMEEGKIDQDPSILEVPAKNWTRYWESKACNTSKWDTPQKMWRKKRSSGT